MEEGGLGSRFQEEFSLSGRSSCQQHATEPPTSLGVREQSTPLRIRNQLPATRFLQPGPLCQRFPWPQEQGESDQHKSPWRWLTFKLWTLAHVTLERMARPKLESVEG